MKTALLSILMSFFSFSMPNTEKFWIGGKLYNLNYDNEDNVLTLPNDFEVVCWLVEGDLLTDDGSDIFVDKYGNYFHLAWTDYGIVIVPIDRKWVNSQYE